jgi:hypothetical protein
MTPAPAPSSPTTFVSGTATSSKKQALTRQPPITRTGWISTPTDRVSISSTDRPWWRSDSGSVRTRAKIQSARWAPDVQSLAPFTT